MSDTTPTAARTRSPEGSHWYAKDGTPCYEVPKKSEPGAMRPTTLADARKLDLLPSVTTILRVLHKQGLVDWLVEQSCLAVLTAPRKEGETLDAFVERVLHTERQQDQESQKARDLGTEIHDAMEKAMSGQESPAHLVPWIGPACQAVLKYGRYVTAEKVLVGDGYAGKTDLIQESDTHWFIWDYKTTKKLPNPEKGGAWSEHRMQLAAYAAAFWKMVADKEGGNKPIKTANCYISTVEQGRFVICETPDWQQVFNAGFWPCVELWQFLNSFKPQP